MGHVFDAVTPDAGGIELLSEMFASATSPAIIAGDEVARSGAFHTLVLLAEQLGAPVFNEPLRAQLAFPNNHPSYAGRLPLEAGSIRKTLDAHDLILMIGGVQLDEVWYDEGEPFPDRARRVQIETTRAELAVEHHIDLGLFGDLAETLTLTVEALQKLPAGYKKSAVKRNTGIAEQRQKSTDAAQESLKRVWDTQPMAPARALHELASALPANSIVVDESITASVELARVFNFTQPGDYIGGRGGGIGQGIAGAIGVQVAQPERTVVALTGDGSAMYSIQSLWTASHHNLPVLFVILSNREYRVLKHNMDIYRSRFKTNSNKPYPNMDLTDPLLGFVDIAKGYGVQAEQVTDADTIAERVSALLATKKPALLDIVVSGKEFGM